MSDTVDTFKHRGFTIEIHIDQDCPSPRKNDNLGTIIAWHRNYNLSDDDAPKHLDPSDFDPSQYAVCLPVYMMDHGNVSLSTGSYGDPWDSGQVGWIYVTREKMLSDALAKRATKKVIANAVSVLKSEIEEYGMYVNGECYGYTVKDADGNELDSCWGFIGDYVRTAATEAADYEADKLAKDRKAQADTLRAERRDKRARKALIHASGL